MLHLRILTAAVLLLVVAAAVAVPSRWPMLGLLALMTGCAWWEWLRLTGTGTLAAYAGGALAVLVLMGLALPLQQDAAAWLAVFPRVLLPLAVAFWLLAAPVAVYRARLTTGAAAGAWAVLGAVLLGAMWYGLAWVFLRHGAAALISLWALVWCADIAAYATGRILGRHKLAVRVSPGKTLEGAAGGILAALLWLVATALWWPDSFGALLLARVGWAGVVASGIILVVWSIIGDLFESLLKRRAGVKDSSRLLPGHGGVYDRIDAVLPVAPAAVLLLIS